MIQFTNKSIYEILSSKIFVEKYIFIDQYILNLYLYFLPTILFTTTTIGFFAGLIEQTNIYNKKLNNYNGKVFFNKMIGYMSLGIMVGITYPISIPIYSAIQWRT
jgi:hypothetical protein